MKKFPLLVLTVLLMGACAKERSDTDRKREERERQALKLNQAVGEFEGFALLKDKDAEIPIAIAIAPKGNPNKNDEDPGLQSTIRIGMFGGMTMASDTVAYDAGSRRLVASFKRATGAPLQLVMLAANGVVSEAKLSGPNQGDIGLSLFPKEKESIFKDDDQFSFHAAIRAEGIPANDAGIPVTLGLKRTDKDVVAPADSDLSSLPGLDGSLRFAYLGRTPEVAKGVLYDPLKATLELQLGDSTRLIFNDVYLKDQTGINPSLNLTTPLTLSGSMSVGAKSDVAKVVASKNPTSLEEPTGTPSDLPPRTFIGKYRGASDQEYFTVLSSIEYQGSSGQNSKEFAFSSFPKLRMKMLVCNKGEVMLSQSFDLQSLDHLRGLGRFENIDRNSGAILDLKFDGQWRSLNGVFKSTTSSGANTGTDASALELIQSGEIADGCAHFPNDGVDLQYVGKLSFRDSRSIPFGINVLAKRLGSASGDESVSLQGVIRAGLFGGVSIATQTARFDLSTGQLHVVIPRGSAAATEVVGVFKNDKSFQGSLLAPSTGTYSLVLRPGDINGLFSNQEEFDYDLSFKSKDSSGNPVTLTANLALKRQEQNGQAPADHDLPLLAPLYGAVRLNGLARTPQDATVIYDPFRGTLRLRLVDSTSELELVDVFSKESDVTSQPDVLNGSMSSGATTISTVTADATRATSPVPTDAPPKFYVGTYQATAESTKLAAFATIDDLGTAGHNSSDYPFPVYPNLRLKVTICIAGGDGLFKTFDLSAVDALKQTAEFKNLDAEQQTRLLTSYSSGWTSLRGSVVTSTSPTNGAAKIELASVSSAPQGCGSVNIRNRHLRDILARNTREEDRREDETTRRERNPSDGTLTYNGHVEIYSGGFIPVALSIFPKRNPTGGDDNPTLMAQLRLGLFGGVTIASEPAFFDWGTGKIIASFHRSSGPALEFKTTIKDDVLDDATLVGPNLGSLRMTLAHSAAPMFDDASEFFFRTAFATDETPDPTSRTDAVFSLKRRTDDQPAPANSDLPLFPGIDGSLRLLRIGQTPQVARSVMYDALKATMTVTLTDSSQMEIDRLVLTKGTDGTLTLPTFVVGRLMNSGSMVAKIKSLRVNASPSDFPLLPPGYFVGTFQGAGGGTQVFRSVAYLNYVGTAGRNSSELSFPVFPNMRLKVITCLGNQPFSQKNLDLIMVDFLNGRARFKSANGGTGSDSDLDLHFSRHWDRLQGTFSNADSSGTGNGAQLQLSSTSTGSSGGCADQ